MPVEKVPTQPPLSGGDPAVATFVTEREGSIAMPNTSVEVCENRASNTKVRFVRNAMPITHVSLVFTSNG